jgi:uncharacterized protein (TIGR02421 family)
MADQVEKLVTKSKRAKRDISDALIATITRRLAQDKRVRRTLPHKGRLHVDRQLPFLCVNRRPQERTDAGTDQLVKGEASYLIAPGAAGLHKQTSGLVRQVVKTLANEFGAFLILELWAAPDGGKANDPAVPTVAPTFTIHAPKSAGLTRTVEVLQRRLKKIKVLKQGVEVEVVYDGKSHPPDMRPLLTVAERQGLHCSTIGVAVPPVYRKPNSTDVFPLLLRSFRNSLALALRQTFFEFTRSRTTHQPPHYHALGRKAVVKAVWEIDRQLAEVSNQFDYLLQLTPVNTHAAWNQFRRQRFERVPEFHYRPLPVDPSALKRELYKIAVDRVEDPALQRLFQEKLEELELKLTMLRDRDTPRFLYESLQLFGGVEDELLSTAVGLLEQLKPGGKRRGAAEGHISAEQFARRAEEEFEFYRQRFPEFKAKTKVAGDVASLIVSRGRLMINSDMTLPKSRVEPLLAHEVGTHLVTYYNGRSQPFQQLYSGLAGYEQLQEGLAVLSEYLVGGLTRARMRQLAGRVVAARHMIDGATFVETFRSLDRRYEFSQSVAYNITMRIYRGGGLTKDAIYLRGLLEMLRYVQKGGDLEPLFVGKMAIDHIPIIRELQYRNVLEPAPVRPRYMESDDATARLARLRDGDQTLLDLLSD